MRRPLGLCVSCLTIVEDLSLRGCPLCGADIVHRVPRPVNAPAATPRSIVRRPLATNAEIVRRVTEAYNRRDLETLLKHAHPAITLVPTTSKVALGGKAYRGLRGVRRYLDELPRYWHAVRFSIEDVFEIGDRVVAVGRRYSRGAGGETEGQGCLIFELRDGLVVRFEGHYDRRRAAAALGLPSEEAPLPA